MRCKNAKFNEDGRYDCKVTGDKCVYLIPNESQCIKDKYLDNEEIMEFAKLNNISYKQSLEILEEWKASQEDEMQEVYEDIIRKSR